MVIERLSFRDCYTVRSHSRDGCTVTEFFAAFQTTLMEVASRHATRV
jgi:hypothetical protein